MVSTSHPAVTDAALRVLRDGGNAVDALLTAMPLQHVVEPQMSTLAGGFGALYWEAQTGRAIYLNANLDRASGVAVAGDSVPETSGQRIGVPGTVTGMRALAERFGTRPWASYFGPAIATAEDGFPMYSFLYGEMAAAFDRITHYPSGREQYTPDGFIPPVGTLFRQPKLAAALRRVSQPDGADWFQRGAWAESFVKAVRSTGGTLAAEDLAAYEPRWDQPLHFQAFGHEMLGGPPPEYGPAYSAVGLGILERAGLDAEHWQRSPRSLALVARALAVSERYVGGFCLDPAGFDVPIETLLSDAFLTVQARLLAGSFPTVDLTPKEYRPVASSRSTGADSLSTGSNHIVIVDGEGNWLTMLHTVFGTPFGTGLVVDGISVNSGNIVPFGGTANGPARRISTPLPPVLVLRDGLPWLGIGSPGASCHAVALVLLNMLRYGMDLDSAIDAPRFRLRSGDDASSGWRIGKLEVETRIPDDTLRGLARYGIDVDPLGDYNWHMGSIQAVARDHVSGDLLGAADPRRGGYAAGF
jgi:gamma-glutamyltranspeptidase/glutathione hydrolase